MITPKIPDNEEARLKALYSYSILDTITDPDFENIVTIASEICGTSISSISLIDKDRQWFKAKKGMDKSETSRNNAFCAHAINDPDHILEVENAAEDPRFHDNPNVVNDPNIAFYAGVPLVDHDGFALGTLCVIDQKPKRLTTTQRETLKALSRQVINLMEMRRKSEQMEQLTFELHRKIQHLEKFALILAHDIRSPLTAISGLTNHLSTGFNYELSAEMKEILGVVSKSSKNVVNLVDGILEYSRNSNRQLADEEFEVKEFFVELRLLFPSLAKESLSIQSDLERIWANPIGLKQILLNLITNAIKYNDKETISITVNATSDDKCYHFSVSDNGMGIPEQHLTKIFDIFTKVHKEDRFGNVGSGIGLATVKNLVTAMKGEIGVKSEVGVGTTFEFSLPKKK